MGGEACALVILDNLIGERVGAVHHRHHDRRDGLAPGKARCPKAPLADADDVKAVAIFRGDDDRLQDAARGDRGSKILELRLVEHAPRIFRIGHDPVERQILDAPRAVVETDEQSELFGALIELAHHAALRWRTSIRRTISARIGRISSAAAFAPLPVSHQTG